MQNFIKILKLLLFVAASIIADQSRMQNELKKNRSGDVFYTRFNFTMKKVHIILQTISVASSCR